MENIKLSNLKFDKLLPQWMREDATDHSLAESIDEIVADMLPRVRALCRVDDVENMTEDQLDEIAWERQISWYQYGATLEQKREAIKNAKLIERKLGTPWAVEQVVRIYYEEAHVTEWFEYGGTPGRFKVRANNLSPDGSDYAKFLEVLNKVKRKGQILDAVEIGKSATMPYYALTGCMTVYHAPAIHEKLQLSRTSSIEADATTNSVAIIQKAIPIKEEDYARTI